MRDGAEKQTDGVPTSCSSYSRVWGTGNSKFTSKIVSGGDEDRGNEQDNGIRGVAKDKLRPEKEPGGPGGDHCRKSPPPPGRVGWCQHPP